MLLYAIPCFLVCLTTITQSINPPDLPSPFLSGPGSYYDGINTNLNGTAFQKQLFQLISVHSQLTYDQLWTAFKTIDANGFGCNAGTVEDIYSSKCWMPGTQQCGNYKKEGDCYNREHSWPKSWWGGEQAGYASYTDLFHLFPSDGYDNGRRSDYPLGTVSAPIYTTSNGCKLGPCTAPGFSGTCWEVGDDHKGTLARGYFYISTAYMGVFACCNTDGVNGSRLKPWMENVLREWHSQFPPTADELRRNDLIFQLYQGNRNPFIDYPEWVDKITFSQ